MKIKCPACSQILNIPDSAAGQVVKCPCGKQLRAPAAGTPASGAPAAAPAKPQGPIKPAGTQPAGSKPAGAKPTGIGAKVGPGAGNPNIAAPRAGSAPSDFDAAMFDELTKRDLKPVKGVTNPYASTAAPAGGGSNLLKQYAPRDSRGGTKEIASVGSRILGAIVDGLFNLLFVGIGGAVGFVVAGPIEPSPDIAQLLPLFVSIWVAALVPFVINAVLISKSGQSVGKKLVGTRIVDQQTGAPAGFVQGFLMRSIVFGFITQIPFIGVFIAIADIVYLFIENHQTLHDKLAKTIVVKA